MQVCEKIIKIPFGNNSHFDHLVFTTTLLNTFRSLKFTVKKLIYCLFIKYTDPLAAKPDSAISIGAFTLPDTDTDTEKKTDTITTVPNGNL